MIGFSDKARTEALPKAEIPTGYYKLPQTFVSSGAPIVWPKFSEEIDADACLAIVIGKPGRRIPLERAWDHVAGATLIIDITARDINKREGLTTNNLLGKNFPSSTCIGPAVLLQPAREELERIEVEPFARRRRQTKVRPARLRLRRRTNHRPLVDPRHQARRLARHRRQHGDGRRSATKSCAAENRLDDPLLFAGDRRAVAPSRRRSRRCAPMKLVTFIHQDKERIGAVDNLGRIVDLHRAYASHLRKVESNSAGDRLAEIVLGRDMVEFLKRGNEALAAARNALDHIASYDVNSGGVFRPRARSSQIPGATARRSYFRWKEFLRSCCRDGVKKGPTAPVAFLKLRERSSAPRTIYPTRRK